MRAAVGPAGYEPEVEVAPRDEASRLPACCRLAMRAAVGPAGYEPEVELAPGVDPRVGAPRRLPACGQFQPGMPFSPFGAGEGAALIGATTGLWGGTSGAAGLGVGTTGTTGL
ncbi:hypothetical protein HBI60_032430 [Parastagonospora nodorum]|nr:hypothetical protein HBI71_004600 [Parastagonospora nodorum]KAH6405778.1 hypothetical protein HBI60_032430 [Parastagonospora nodorum]